METIAQHAMYWLFQVNYNSTDDCETRYSRLNDGIKILDSNLNNHPGY